MWIKIEFQTELQAPPVTSFTLVWIKIADSYVALPDRTVTSFTLVWIKIKLTPPRKENHSRHELHARVD